ncbi:hypothetical protein HDU93_009013 [Gonapodya sp. JEL0774]|nr:hypothetical protein HDU93_009013 [Gonapodya sp. JEL0774]
MAAQSLQSHLIYAAPLPAPNPRRVDIFLREKGGEFARIPIQQFNLQKVEQKTPEHYERNVMGQVPTLRLPNGTFISESVSICEYLEFQFPDAPGPKLFGATPFATAIISQWIRRIELRVMSHVGQVWINTHPATVVAAKRMGMKRFQDFGEESKARYFAQLKWLDKLFAKKAGAEVGRELYVADLDPALPLADAIGFSMADITLICTVDFATLIGLAIPQELTALRAWHGRVTARPSVAAENGRALKFRL